jgi:hypothetical protein
MRRGLLAVVLVVAGSSLVAAQRSGSNGVYGGYVGSSAWFSSMRQSAQNMAMLRQLGGGNAHQPVPADYIEIAGQFVFPQGNPFPKGRLPDLRIQCDAPCPDAVERSPHIFQAGNGATFYSVLKQGHTYTFSWMYYMGGKEAFTTYKVPSGSPKQVQASIAIDAKGHGRPAGMAAGAGDRTSSGGAEEGVSPQAVQKWPKPTLDNNYRSPQSDGAYRPPLSDGSYQPPVSDGGYRRPSSDGGYR